MKHTNTFMKKRFFIGLIALAAVITFAGCATSGGTNSGGLAAPGADDHRFTEKTIPAGSQTLAAALEWIRANAVQWGAYTITVKADETIAAQYLGFDSKRVRITLTGDEPGREVRLSGTDSLFVVGRGVTLNIENLTLKGRGNRESEANNRALIRVDAEGVLKLKAGALITENYSSDCGGAVHVGENAVFIMEGGEIRGNTAKGDETADGGGVFIGEKAVFTMKGGTISGNTAKGGGGVAVWKGTFTMEGGEISGNTATEWPGGGVKARENAVFTMTGGTISGNTAASEGGGGVTVEENALFTMNDGEISGNAANAGGGVIAFNNGTFIMEGGTIRDNMARRSGGGLQIFRASVIKKGGTIYGDTDSTHTAGSSENTAQNGQGHAVGLGDGKRRNADAGPELNLYAAYANGAWTYTDSSKGGVGDTTANWD